MKKRLSIKELKEYFDCHHVKEITFCTDNQDWYQVADPCKVRITFTIMLISESPSLVFLKSPIGSMCFDRVRFAEIDTKSTVLGTVIIVYCGGGGVSDPEITYTLIAS